MTIHRSQVLRCRIISDISCTPTTARESGFNPDEAVIKRRKSDSGLKAAAAAAATTSLVVAAPVVAKAASTAATGEEDNSHIVGHINEDGSIEPGKKTSLLISLTRET
jgi:hypothetical protein